MALIQGGKKKRWTHFEGDFEDEHVLLKHRPELTEEEKVEEDVKEDFSSVIIWTSKSVLKRKGSFHLFLAILIMVTSNKHDTFGLFKDCCIIECAET